MLRADRPVKQNLVTQVRRQRHHIGLLQAIDDGLERQCVQLEIALDVALRDQRNITQRVARVVQCVLPALIQHHRA